MRKRTFALALTVALVVGLLPLGAAPAAAYTAGEVFPVAAAYSGQIQPDIDYPWIVWKDGRECPCTIYAYNFMTGETRQVSNPTESDDATNPSISGDWVVWHQELSGGSSIHAYNLTTGDSLRVADGEEDGDCYGNPAIDGTTVVFRFDGDGGLYAYDLADQAAGVWRVSTDDGYDRYGPEVGDGWAVCRVWREDTGNWTYDIEAYDLSDPGAAPIVIPGHYTDGSDYVDFDGPSTDAGMLTYMQYGYWDYTGDEALEYGEAIMLYDLAAGGEPVQISSVDANDTDREHPVINDGLVSWHDMRRVGSMEAAVKAAGDNQAGSEVYVYDLEAGTETCVVPAVYDEDTSSWVSYAGRTTTADGIVAWQDHRAGDGDDSYSDIYAMFLFEPTVAVDDWYATSQNAPLAISAASGLLANDSCTDGSTLTALKASDPANGDVVVNADGSFVYVPDSAFAGTDTFTYEACGANSSAIGTVTITVTPSTELNEETGAVWRFYNPVSGSHFYTPSLEERNYVISHYLGVWVYEGYAFTALPAQGTVGIHRLYNAKVGAHFYTPSDTEQATVLAKWPTIFTYEGRSFPVTLAPGANTLTVHRFYNTKTGAHFYTASEAEKASVIAKYPGLFIYEGVGFYTVTSL